VENAAGPDWPDVVFTASDPAAIARETAERDRLSANGMRLLPATPQILNPRHHPEYDSREKYGN
jgi:hypothetical protein